MVKCRYQGPAPAPNLVKQHPGVGTGLVYLFFFFMHCSRCKLYYLLNGRKGLLALQLSKQALRLTGSAEGDRLHQLTLSPGPQQCSVTQMPTDLTE